MRNDKPTRVRCWRMAAGASHRPADRVSPSILPGRDGPHDPTGATSSGCGSVVAAAFKPFRHTGNTFQTKLAVVLGVEGVVGLDKGGEMVVEDTSQYIFPPRDIRGGLCGRDGGGYGASRRPRHLRGHRVYVPTAIPAGLIVRRPPLSISRRDPCSGRGSPFA